MARRHLVTHPTCGCGLVAGGSGSDGPAAATSRSPTICLRAVPKHSTRTDGVHVGSTCIHNPTTATRDVHLKHADAPSLCPHMFAKMLEQVLQLARSAMVSFIRKGSACLHEITALAPSGSSCTRATHTWRTEANHCPSRLQTRSIDYTFANCGAHVADYDGLHPRPWRAVFSTHTFESRYSHDTFGTRDCKPTTTACYERARSSCGCSSRVASDEDIRSWPDPPNSKHCPSSQHSLLLKMALEPLGRNWGDIVNWDDLGKAYAGFIIAWTVILYAGVAWLIKNRDLPFIKIRNVPIAVASVTCLHLYLIKIVLAYTTNGHFLCSLEFWIMSIYLPFGIALFQANLVQLYSISDQQQKLATSAASTSTALIASRSGVRSWWQQWKDLPQIKKSYTYIGIGMFIQVIITAAIYAATPELQGDWRSFGKVPHAKGQALCRKSAAWVPSAFWQLAWSWFFGLWTLWKIRNIHDTHYWRLGTWLSVISGLPGTPLWIAAVFCIQFKPVNIRWVPPMWLAPGIIVMQAVTVFFPIYEAFISRAHMRETLTLIKNWEEKGSQSGEPSVSSGEASNLSVGISTRSKETFSMASLEKALAVNPLPLLHFAASKDFTAENIIFLMRVREWRQAYASAPRLLDTTALTADAQELLFRMGADIYTTCVSDTYSEFPINIDHNIKVALDNVFALAVSDKKKRLSDDSASSSPWDIDMEALQKAPIQLEIQRMTLSRETSDESVDTMWSAKTKSLKSQSSRDVKIGSMDDDERPIFARHPAIAPLGVARAKIRPAFDGAVFDAAEASIKYLVLTNTWRKFAQEAQGGDEKGMV